MITLLILFMEVEMNIIVGIMCITFIIAVIVSLILYKNKDEEMYFIKVIIAFLCIFPFFLLMLHNVN